MLKVTNICLLDAKAIKKLDLDTVLISINAPDERPPDLGIDRNNSRVLTVSFWDICASRDYNGQMITPIDGDTAMKIIDFIRYWKHKNFIVHCQAGISRSAAVAMFIHQLYGHELKKGFWHLCRPNPYVLGKLYLLHEQML